MVGRVGFVRTMLLAMLTALTATLAGPETSAPVVDSLAVTLNGTGAPKLTSLMDWSCCCPVVVTLLTTPGSSERKRSTWPTVPLARVAVICADSTSGPLIWMGVQEAEHEVVAEALLRLLETVTVSINVPPLTEI